MSVCCKVGKLPSLSAGCCTDSAVLSVVHEKATGKRKRHRSGRDELLNLVEDNHSVGFAI